MHQQVLDILDRIQKKICEINCESSESLKRLDEREGHKYKNITSMFDCDISYYINVARYAWAARAKQIAMLDMQKLVDEIKKEYMENTRVQ